nr:MAG TPA: hypothetical protein [Caudoviricetes sp.]
MAVFICCKACKYLDAMLEVLGNGLNCWSI